MYVRLAFAVAAHLEVDILIIDEVLAVGDAQFQKKCLGKMGEIAQGGRTILFVSHNMGAVLQLCTRGIQLYQGLIVSTGTAEETVTHYIGKGEAGKSSLIYEPRPDKDVQITGISVLSADGVPVGCLPHDQSFFVNIEYTVRRWPLNSYVTFDLFDQLGTQLLWSCDVKSADEMAVRRQPGVYQASVRVPEGILNPGVYNINSAVYSPSEGVHDMVPEVISLELSDGGSLLSKLGILRSPAQTAITLDWTTQNQSYTACGLIEMAK
jgi:lipopolysaccharide transport system ATP-binding protein